MDGAALERAGAAADRCPAGEAQAPPPNREEEEEEGRRARVGRMSSPLSSIYYARQLCYLLFTASADRDDPPGEPS